MQTPGATCGCYLCEDPIHSQEFKGYSDGHKPVLRTRSKIEFQRLKASVWKGALTAEDKQKLKSVAEKATLIVRPSGAALPTLHIKLRLVNRLLLFVENEVQFKKTETQI